MAQLAKQEACQLYIEQEIEGGLEREETPYQIAKRLIGEMQKLFEVSVKLDTIRKRAQRQKKKLGTNVPKKSNNNTNSATYESSKSSVTHPVTDRGGKREGAGRPPKFKVIEPTNRTQGTGDNEWYTPVECIEAAREVLGGIDLDPATSEFAQSRIKAKKYFNRETDGLSQEWHGRIWLNPPYAQPLMSKFIDKLVKEYNAGHITETIVLTHNYTDTSWFHLIESVCSSICFTRGRIKFEKADGTVAAPTQGSAFFYIGDNRAKFAEVFKEFGFIR